MSFIPAYLAAGIGLPDFDLRVVPIFQFPDERRCLEWFRKVQKARRIGLPQAQPGGHMPDAELRRGILAAVTGLPAPDPKYDKLSVGIDTSHFRVPGFLLTRAVAGEPDGGSLNGAVGVASEGLKLSVSTIWRLWWAYRPIAHLAAALNYCRDSLRWEPRAALEWAESLRLKGEQYQPPHAREPLLDRTRAVKMPPDLGLRVVPLGLPPAEKFTITI